MIKQIKILTLILFTIVIFGFYNSEVIEEIKMKYSYINDSIENFDKTTDQDINVYKDLNPENYSFESTELFRPAIVNLDRFYENGKLRKAVVQFQGDREDLISEYYFWGDSLFFVFKTNISYAKPKWVDGFDSTKKILKENRYYFENEKLIRWIDFRKLMVDLNQIKTKRVEREILSDAKLYINIE